MGLLVKIVIAAAALWVAVQVVPGLDFEGSVVTLLLVALVLGIINAVVKPILTVLSLPFIILTLGLFLLVVNAIALWIVIRLSGALDLGLTSDGFGSTFLGALVVSLVAWGLETVTGVRD
ncbi:MAG: phage holin family protein [Nitriliruptor sp.]|uniref:phage holin family protein n=1 Tax=Nitriliruptor sp. TaxID=2448056 RepID=UPI0034A03791